MIAPREFAALHNAFKRAFPSYRIDITPERIFFYDGDPTGYPSAEFVDYDSANRLLRKRLEEKVADIERAVLRLQQEAKDIRDALAVV